MDCSAHPTSWRWGAQLAIRNLNIQVPETLKLVGAGDFLRDVVSGPSLSSVRLVVSDTADIIVEELLSMMETGKPLNTETLCMPVQLDEAGFAGIYGTGKRQGGKAK